MEPFVTSPFAAAAHLAPALFVVLPLLAQDPAGGFPFGPGGPGGPRSEDQKVLAQFDADQNGRLDAAERQQAKAWLAENRPQRQQGMRGGRGSGPGDAGPGAFPGGQPGVGGPGAGGPGFGGPGAGGPGGGGRYNPDAKGDPVAPADVPHHRGAAVWDPDVVRTVFLQFESPDWHAELAAFYRTDVLVPATVQIDGETFANVGVAFRGNTSYQMVRGKKKSFDLQFDWVDAQQHWRGVRNLDLVNGNGDASFVREALHGWVATQFLPAPRVALVRVVVDGEDFGIYSAVQQFDKEFTKDHFGTGKGARWKVPPDFSGNGGLRYLGEDAEAYRRNYQIKSKDEPQQWQALIDLCGALDAAATEDLERILPQHLDIDGALWFLAIDHALADDDGYYSRASDYCLYRDPNGKFHLVARDNNEILLARGNRGPGGAAGPGGQGGAAGGGRRGGPGGGSAATPLAGADRADRPLLRRLLEVPAWRQRYLQNLRTIADTALQDATVQQRLDAWQQAIEPIVARDQHSPYDHAAFARNFAADAQGQPLAGSLRAVIAARRQAILGAPEMQDVARRR